MTQLDVSKYPWPRRRLIRGLIKPILAVAFGTLSDLQIEGTENLPTSGPLLVAANHFSFVDPPLVIRALPWPLDFVGGFQMPNAPASAIGFAQGVGILSRVSWALFTDGHGGGAGRDGSKRRAGYLPRGRKLGYRAASAAPRRGFSGSAHQGTHPARWAGWL